MDRLDAERRLLEPHRTSKNADIIAALTKIDKMLGKLDAERTRKHPRISMIGIHLANADSLIKRFLRKHG